MFREKTRRWKRVKQWGLLCAVMAALWANGVQASDIVDIRLYPTASISGRSVYLSQIASIHGDDSEKVRKLSEIRIDAAPQPGRSMLVHQNTVERRLQRYGVDDTQYRLAAAGPVKVLRRFAQIEPDLIRKAVKAFILKNAPWDADQIRIPKIRFNQPVIIPPGSVTLSVKAPKHTDWIGAIPFVVQIMVGGESVKKVTVPVNIEVWSQVVVVAKPLGKFQPISADTIRIEKMDLARVPHNAVLNPDQVIGRRTNRNIAANSILRGDQIELPPVVRRGDVVQVIAETTILKITVKGIVKQNGGVGERVRVVNLRSKKTIYAQVLDKQTVKVEF